MRHGTGDRKPPVRRLGNGYSRRGYSLLRVESQLEWPRGSIAGNGWRSRICRDGAAVCGKQGSSCGKSGLSLRKTRPSARAEAPDANGGPSREEQDERIARIFICQTRLGRAAVARQLCASVLVPAALREGGRVDHRRRRAARFLPVLADGAAGGVPHGQFEAHVGG